MKFTQRLVFAGACAAFACMAGSAVADEATPNTVRLGLYFVSFHPSAPDLSGPYTPPGLNLSMNSVTTPYAAYLRDITPHFTIELAGGVPPNTEAVARGPATLGSVPYNGQLIAKVKWFSPSLLFEYNFCDPSAALRPYVGVGVNYTSFYNREVSAAGEAIVGGPTSVSLSHSMGPAATAGVAYKLPHHFQVMASYSYAQIKSDFVANTSGIVRSTSVNFHPSTWVVGAGYSF